MRSLEPRFVLITLSVKSPSRKSNSLSSRTSDLKVRDSLVATTLSQDLTTFNKIPRTVPMLVLVTSTRIWISTLLESNMKFRPRERRRVKMLTCPLKIYSLCLVFSLLAIVDISSTSTNLSASLATMLALVAMSCLMLRFLSPSCP